MSHKLPSDSDLPISSSARAVLLSSSTRDGADMARSASKLHCARKLDAGDQRLHSFRALRRLLRQKHRELDMHSAPRVAPTPVSLSSDSKD
jgi:hypothetical protein